jgi:hypothetical protein
MRNTMAPMQNMPETTTPRSSELDLMSVGAKVRLSERSVDGKTESLVGEQIGVTPFTSVAKVGFSESSVDGEREINVGEMVGVARSTFVGEVGFSESSVDGKMEIVEGEIVGVAPATSVLQQIAAHAFW